MEEYRFQIRDKKVAGAANYAVGAQIKHKVFGEGIIEEIDETAKTYLIRFMYRTKPISFDYQGVVTCILVNIAFLS